MTDSQSTPPSDELSWEQLALIERTVLQGSARSKVLCRTIRSLCATRDSLIADRDAWIECTQHHCGVEAEYAEQNRALFAEVTSLTAKLAERDAEIERLRNDLRTLRECPLFYVVSGD